MNYKLVDVAEVMTELQLVVVAEVMTELQLVVEAGSRLE